MLITCADDFGDMNFIDVSEVEQPRLPFDDLDDDLPDEGPDSDDYSELDFDDWDRDEGHIYESIEDEIGDDLDQLDAEFDAE